MTVANNREGTANGEDVEALEREVRALRKTCAVLKKRVQSSVGDSESSFARFERQAHLQRVLDERTEQIRKQAECVLEDNRERARVEALLNDSQRLAQVGGWMFDLSTESMQFTSEFYRILDIEPGQCVTIEDTLDYYVPEFREEVQVALTEAIGSQTPFDLEGKLCTGAGKEIWVRVQARVYTEDGRASRILGLISDMTERKVVEMRLAQSQKMESVGQLASGIAHEINTPTQFVNDNVTFLRGAFEDLEGVVQACRGLVAKVGDASLQEELDGILEQADYDYLQTEVPAAIEQSIEGLGRVAKLVGAMKGYAHPGREAKELADLNRAIESTVTVARNEWKYLCEIDYDLAADLPNVPCLLADFNQVVLNMVVNSVHAIEERFGRTDEIVGRIRIATRQHGDHVCVTIGDNGNGMPEDVRRRIFDPFYTTKEVGKGTGQGLSISHQVITDRHGGRIEVHSEPGQGTTFELWLPLSGESA